MESARPEGGSALNKGQQWAYFSGTMGRPEQHPRAASTADQTHQLHRRLALALGALAGLLLVVRGPADERAANEDGAPPARAEVSRAELDAAIASLTAWVDRSSRAPRTPLETNQRLLALGRAVLDDDAAAVADSLQRLTLARPPPPVPASLSAQSGASSARPRSRASTADEGRDASAAATLAILLEAGTPLERELPLPGGPSRVAGLLELALPEADARSSGNDPWAMDLLSFSLLAGMTQHREALARRVHAGLLELERGKRPVAGSARAARPADERHTGLDSLQLGASVLRALAVLAEADLTQRGLRYLNGLVHRYPAERELWRERVALAGDEAERIAIHVRAIEALGQLEQTLFGAHLAFRRGESGEPAPRAATGMRRAAGDLLEHLTALERAGAFAGERATNASPELLRAAVQALRGLRAARVAT